MTSSDTPVTQTSARGFAGQPDGLGLLFFVELWERFSYYGMRALLTLFMVAAPVAGGLGLATDEATRIYGNYTMAVYMLSIPGGFIADALLGARRTVLIGGSAIAAGHFVLAVPAAETFVIGLALVAIGTGLFKPNISALVGNLYAPNDPRRDAGFSIFYMGINIGGFLAPLVTGYLAQSASFKAWLAGAGFDPAHSWHWGFGAAGVGMVIGLIAFFYKSRGIESFRSSGGLSAGAAFDRSALQNGAIVIAGTLGLMALTIASDRPDYQWLRWLFLAAPIVLIAWFALRPDAGAKRIAAIFVLFIAAMLFWAIFEQAGTTIALFADQLTRSEVAGVVFPSAWFQSINPVFVILLAPFFAALWFTLGDRQPSSPMKFVIGLMLLSLSFALMIPAAQLTAEGRVSPLWLVGLFFLQTAGELCLSPVGLSAMTTLAPPRAVGLVLGIWFLAAAWGNKLAGVFGGAFTATDPGGLASFFLTQAALVAVAAIALWVSVPFVKRLMATPD